jgi:hypothetical protein
MPDLERTEEEKELKVPIKDMPRNRSAGFTSTYANNTNASSTFWDLRLFFGEIIFVPGSEIGAQIEDHVSVTMSWEHAKAVHALLGRMIDRYEERYGKTIREQPKTIEVTG